MREGFGATPLIASLVVYSVAEGKLETGSGNTKTPPCSVMEAGRDLVGSLVSECGGCSEPRSLHTRLSPV